MDKASYRVACPQLKKFHDAQASNIVYCPWLITIAIMAFHIIFLVTCYATFHPTLSFRPSVGCLLLPKWSSDLKYDTCPPACAARGLGSCVSNLVVIRCALSFCISSSVILCSITIQNSQNGNTGIRHNRKKTVSPLRSVIAGFHCMSMRYDYET